jgi:predicted nucleic acid-binding Zn ribbon protein
MKKTNTESIRDVMYQFLRENGLEMPLNEFRIIQAWNDVLGDAISRNTKDLCIYNQVLFVTIESSALKNELLMRRTGLIKILNERVGAQVITKIIFK